MKRLIVCCDGTWQKLENNGASNVVKIAQSVRFFDDHGIQQILYYGEGLGTEGDFVYDLGGGAFGWGIDQKIKTAYRFLSLNYEKGDEIYLFGFSRGAYTVRCLAGFINCSGLLNRQYVRKTPEAYTFYRDRDPSTRPGSDRAIQFRKNYGDRVPIQALCCWDTVGALGIPDLIPNFPLDNWVNRKYEFFDTKLNRYIKNAFHAIAIDEIRKSFQVTSMNHSDHADQQEINQLWFAGEHGCIGGGTVATYGLSDITLDWMMAQVEELGLALDRNQLEQKTNPRFDTPFHNQPTGILAWGGTSWRKVEDDILSLHETVKQRWQHDQSYRPQNLAHFSKELNHT